MGHSTSPTGYVSHSTNLSHPEHLVFKIMSLTGLNPSVPSRGRPKYIQKPAVIFNDRTSFIQGN